MQRNDPTFDPYGNNPIGAITTSMQRLSLYRQTAPNAPKKTVPAEVRNFYNQVTQQNESPARRQLQFFPCSGPNDPALQVAISNPNNNVIISPISYPPPIFK